jgi:hypothetical protein
MPDEPLFAAAAAGKLRTRDGVLAEASRLLDTPGGAAMVADFQGQVMHLHEYKGLDEDKQGMAGWSPGLGADTHRETLLLLDDLLVRQKLPVASLYTAKHTFVNRRLATLHGIKGTFTDTKFDRVDLPAERQGILTLPGFLALKAAVDKPDTIQRGVFVAHALACKTLPPPDPNAKPGPPDATKSNRELIDGLTGKGTCGEACHVTLINPPGYALESFDHLGRHRTTDAGKPVNTAGAYLLDGALKPFQNAQDFSSLLAESAEVHACYAGQWIEYLNGRELAPKEDEPAVADLARRLLAGKMPVRSLVLALVISDAFLTRAP